MAYEGYEVPIALGQLGLTTDAAQSQLPPNAATTANNIAFWTGVISKSNGTSRYSVTGLNSPIVCGFDYWPTASQQRTVAVTANGKVWKDTGDGTFSTGTPLLINETQLITWSGVPDGGAFNFMWNGNPATASCSWNDSIQTMQSALRTVPGLSAATLTANLASTGGAANGGYDGFLYGMTITMPGTSSAQPLVVLSGNSLVTGSTAVIPTFSHILVGNTTLGTLTTATHMISGGNEVPNNPRRLFIYSGGVSQLAMITSDSTGVTGINRPAADWANNHPTFGIMFQGRHVAVLGHTIYISKLSDHTDFTTSATDGTGAAQFGIFPGEGDGIVGAIVFKGALLIFKQPFGMYMFQWNGGDIATAGNTSISKVSDSFAIASPHALQQVINDLIGGSISGSLFSQNATNAFGAFEAGDLLVRAQVRNYFRQTFDSAGNKYMQSLYYPEKFLGMFSGRSGGSPTQNLLLMYDAAGTSPRLSVETKDQPTSMWLRKDNNTVPRPFYGADDGYVYQMDQGSWNVNGAAYVGEYTTPYMNFSFLEPKLADKVKIFDFLTIVYQPIGNWSFYVDVYVDGVFIQTLNYLMKQTSAVLDSFILDVDRLGVQTTALQLRQRLRSCTGKSISLRIYNGVADQGFTIEQVILSFRESGEQNRSSK